MTEERRLRPPSEHERTIDALVDEGLFESKQAALVFAAAVGWRRKENRPIGKAGEGVRWQVFERNQDSPFVYALGIAVEQSINILDSVPNGSRTLPDVFEEYAAGGLDYLAQTLNSGRLGDLDSILLMIAEARHEKSDSSIGLEGLSAGALDALGL